MTRRIRGQALIEFALVIAVVVLLMLGILHGGIVFRAYAHLGDAAEKGAQAAAVFGGDAPEVGEAIENSLRENFIYLPYSYTVILPEARPGDPPGRARVGDPVIVRVAYTEPLRFVFLDVMLKPQQALRFVERDYGW